MSSKSRWIVLLISTPLVVLTAIGGLLGASSARQETYPQLRVFSDVISLILNGYVEKVDVDKVMEGAMRGLADGLDASSAYLTPEEVSKEFETAARSVASYPQRDAVVRALRELGARP